MVVDILNEKLDHDHIEYISNMLMKNASGSSSSADVRAPLTRSMSDTGNILGTSGALNPELHRSNSAADINTKRLDEWPEHWEEMDLRAVSDMYCNKSSPKQQKPSNLGQNLLPLVQNKKGSLSALQTYLPGF